METKDFLALAAIPFGLIVCTTAVLLSRAAREVALFLWVAGTVLTEKLDVNLVSHYWYRGSTRGFEISFIDLLALSLLVSTLLTRERDRRWFWPAGLCPMLVYFLYCCASVTFSEPKLYGLFELSKILRSLIIFVAAALVFRDRRELAILVMALACAVWFEGALALKQRYLGGVFRATGTLDHPNSLSMYLCLAGPLLVGASMSELPRIVRGWAGASIPAAMITMTLTVSRAGVPIFGFVMLAAVLTCISWRITLQKVAVGMVAFVGTIGLAYKAWDSVSARFSQSTLAEEYLDTEWEGRGYYLRQAQAIIEDRFFGVGLNNWSYWVSKVYGAKVGFRYEDYDDIQFSPSKEILPSIAYAAPAHNLGALTAGELGWPGLGLFGILWLRWFHVAGRLLWTRCPTTLWRLGAGIFFAIAGIFLQSLVEWVYRQTQILFTFHTLLGVVAALDHTATQERREIAGLTQNLNLEPVDTPAEALPELDPRPCASPT